MRLFGKYDGVLIFFFINIIATPLVTFAQTQRGKATYYSRRSTGARTASGHRLHHDSLTCAHRTHPFGTLLKVTNVENGKSVVVKVTDRGPFARGRIIDLSWRAAKELDMLTKGVSMVKVEVYNGEQGIPYRPSGTVPMPEMDFEISEDGYDFLGEWAKKSMNTTLSDSLMKARKAAAHSATKAKTNATPTHTKKKAAPAKAKDDKKDEHIWSGFLDKLKEKGSELF